MTRHRAVEGRKLMVAARKDHPRTPDRRDSLCESWKGNLIECHEAADLLRLPKTDKGSKKVKLTGIVFDFFVSLSKIKISHSLIV